MEIVSLRFGTAFLSYYTQYIGNEYSSSGAIYRAIPSFLASILFLLKKNNFNYYYGEVSNFYLRFAYAGIFLTLLIVLFPSNSTFIDRVALYFTPITIFVFTSVVKLKLLRINRLDFKLFMVIAYFFYSFIWLSFAVHAYAWVPYRNFLFL